MSDQNPVATPVDEWKAALQEWDLVDALCGGTYAMRAARSKFLPQEPKEPEVAYNNRVDKSVLTPIYCDAIKKLAGKIMKQPPQPEEGMSPRVVELLDDIDSEGTDLADFVYDLVKAGLNYGLTHILVDSPNFENLVDEMGVTDLTIAVERELGIRPYMMHIKPRQVIGWKSQVINGEKVLTQVRIEMTVKVDSPEDEFTQVDSHRILVLDIGRARVYEEQEIDGQKEWVVVSDVPTDLDFIPLVTIYVNKTGFMQGEPPMVDVAHLNVAHWQSDSDQRNILHVARVPILFGSGLGDEERGDFELAVGPNTMTRGEQGSDLKFVEHSGKGIDAGAKDLETLEARMARLALNMILNRRPGNETATARTLDQAESDSPLAMLATSVESGITKAADLFSVFMGIGEDAGGTIALYKDFGISARDGEDIKHLLAMRASREISRATFWEELKRRGLLSDNFDPEDELALLDVEFEEATELDNEVVDDDDGDSPESPEAIADPGAGE